MGKPSHRRVVIGAICLCMVCMVFLVSFALLQDPPGKTLASVSIGGNQRVEYWRRDTPGYRSIIDQLLHRNPFWTSSAYGIRWHHGGGHQDFVAVDGGDPYYDEVEIRATADKTRLWVVDASSMRNEILVSLDTSSGQFLDRNVMDESGHTGDRSWAVPGQGLLLTRTRRRK